MLQYIYSKCNHNVSAAVPNYGVEHGDRPLIRSVHARRDAKQHPVHSYHPVLPAQYCDGYVSHIIIARVMYIIYSVYYISILVNP